jgi:oligopeptide transport system permease protein
MYFVRRLLFLVPLLLVISILAFAFARLMPGGPFDKERAAASPEGRKALEAKYLLDQPKTVQYWHYLKGLAKGDLGPSMKYRNHTVNDIVIQALPISLALGVSAFLFALGVGIPLGFFTAVYKGRWADYAGSFLALLFFCIPALVVGPVLIMLFAIKMEWFPVALWGSPLHVILPMVTLGIYFAGRIARLMREGMMTTLHAEFVTTARAKGLNETGVLLKHAFRLGVLPVVSYSGPLLADLLTGSFVVETVFQVPGIGVFLVNSLFNRDHTMTVGLVLLYAVLLLVLNLIVDLVYTIIDPRIRYE